MARAIWSGSISFGLINLNVKAYAATARHRIDFDLIHDEDGSRIEYRRVCKLDGKEVPWDHIVKGYEIEPGHYVTFTKAELDALQPDATHTIDIEDFVALSQIEPTFFDTPYYLVPEAGARRAYSLLHAVMTDAGVVAIGRVVLRTRQRLVSVRPLAGGLLAMETLHFASEVRKPPPLPDSRSAHGSEPNARERKIARTLVDELTVDFEPERYRDTYEDEVVERIEQKAEGEVVETPAAEEPAATAANDIMAALEASLKKARDSRNAAGRGGGAKARAKRTRSPRKKATAKR